MSKIRQAFAGNPRLWSIVVIWGLGLLIIGVSWLVGNITGSQQAFTVLAVALVGLFIVGVFVLMLKRPNGGGNG